MKFSKAILFLNALATVAALLLVPAPAHADSWRFPAIIERDVKTYGDISVSRIRDARENQRYPAHSIEVSRADKLLARIPGVYFEELFLAPDGSFFVGLSNDGLPGTAVVVFGKEGDLLLAVRHGMAEFDYCDRSVTLVRTWFDETNPDVKFTKINKWGSYDVTLRTCHGKEVHLITAIQEAYNRSLQRKAALAREEADKTGPSRPDSPPPSTTQ